MDLASDVPVPTSIFSTARKLEAKHVQGLRNIIVPALEHLYGQFYGYLIPLSKALAADLRGFHLETRSMVNLMRELSATVLDKLGNTRDTILVLDSNILIWMAMQNRSIDSLFPAIRKASAPRILLSAYCCPLHCPHRNERDDSWTTRVVLAAAAEDDVVST